MKEPNPDLENLGTMMAAGTKPFEILLAEDSLGDVELVRLALKEHGVECMLRVFRDGGDVITFLRSLDADPKGPALDLLVVDMNLPNSTGEDILKCLRATENYAQTPVIVMSGVIAGATDEKTTRHAAMVYFQKPSTLDGFMQLGSIVRNVLKKQTRGAA
jgi:DNA-binding response OmpR family regulator